MKILATLAFACLPQIGAAVCPDHALTDPARVRLAGDAVLIVTHPSSTYDARVSTKRGIDDAVRFAKDNRIPVVYLQDDSPLQYYFVDDCAPTYWVYSKGGEVPFDLPVSHVYVAGGHLELCLSGTLHDILEIWSRKPPRNLTITYLMDGIYSNGKSVEETDPYYSDFTRFMRVVTYGRPGGESWPKLTLLETMGVINKEEHELAYLTKVLPRYDRTMPAEYRIELKMNDSVVKVLRPAKGWNPPTLRFQFVDSATQLER